MATIDLDKARAERAAANPSAPPETPASLMFSDPKAFAAKHPEAAARLAALGRRTAERLASRIKLSKPIAENPAMRNLSEELVKGLENRVAKALRKKLQPLYGQMLAAIIREARRGRLESAAHRRQTPPRPCSSTPHHGTRREGSSSPTSGVDPGDEEPEPEPTRGPGTPCLYSKCSNVIPDDARADAEFCGISPKTGKRGSEACSRAYRRENAKLEANRPEPWQLAEHADLDEARHARFVEQASEKLRDLSQAQRPEPADPYFTPLIGDYWHNHRQKKRQKERLLERRIARREWADDLYSASVIITRPHPAVTKPWKPSAGAGSGRSRDIRPKVAA